MSKYLNFYKGIYGEKLAQEFLKKQKYKILQTNFKCKVGEIDIVAIKNNIYCFIEVKYRKNLEYGYPREAVTKLKQRKIKRTAEFYLMLNRLNEVAVSFDIIEIVDKDITFIKNAF